MYGKNYLIAMAGIMAMTARINDGHAGEYEPNDIEPKKKPIPAGCKEFTFYGITVVALNEGSARKKCKRLAGVK